MGSGNLYQKRIQFNCQGNLSIFTEGLFESLFIEIKSNKKEAIIGEVYRVPNTNVEKSIKQYEIFLD